MKKIFLFLALTSVFTLTACEKDNPGLDDVPENSPRTDVPAELQGLWMYGAFSTTEYWTQNPSEYIGNAFEIAIAFKFNSNGTYTQYFTSRTVLGGISTYQQSLTTGTVEIDAATKTIKTYPAKAHYKRTRYNQTLEDRDLEKSELSTGTVYSYTTGTETNGTKAVYLTLNGTTDPYTFLQKQ